MQIDDAKYYFVPLGRERGGYLALLGLPPDASEEEAMTKEGEYRQQVDKNYRSVRKEWREKQTKGEITKEEFDAKIKAIEEDLKNKPLMELGELKNKFDAIQADRRQSEREGRTDSSEAAWLPMYRALGRKDFLQLLQRPRPMANVPQDFIFAVQYKWLGSRYESETPLPSERGLDGKLDFTDLLSLVLEQNLMRLLAADALWGEVKHTNRAFWQRQLDEWATLETNRGAHFLLPEGDNGHSTATADATPLFPSLCGRQRRSIDRLEAEPMDTNLSGPKRNSPGDMEAQLKRMLDLFGGRGPNETAANLDDADLQAFLANLQKMAAAAGNSHTKL